MWYKNLLSINFLHVSIYQINELLLTINDLELTYHY